MAIRIRTTVMIAPTLILILCLWSACVDAFAATASSALLKAKQEAEAKGYVFFTNRDEILSKAKNEGKLRVLTSLKGSTKATTEAFRKRYPFIDLHEEVLTAGDAVQRFLLEVKAGELKVGISRRHILIFTAHGCLIFGKSTSWGWPSTEYYWTFLTR